MGFNLDQKSHWSETGFCWMIASYILFLYYFNWLHCKIFIELLFGNIFTCALQINVIQGYFLSTFRTIVYNNLTIHIQVVFFLKLPSHRPSMVLLFRSLHFRSQDAYQYGKNLIEVVPQGSLQFVSIITFLSAWVQYIEVSGRWAYSFLSCFLFSYWCSLVILLASPSRLTNLNP